MQARLLSLWQKLELARSIDALAGYGSSNRSAYGIAWFPIVRNNVSQPGTHKLHMQSARGAPAAGAASAGARASRYAAVGLDDSVRAVGREWARTRLQNRGSRAPCFLLK